MTRRVVLLAAVLVATIATLGLIGWALDIAVFKGFSAELASMKPNTSIGLVTYALALVLAATGSGASARRILAAVVAVIGLATLAEHVLAIEPGIDDLVFALLPRPDPADETRMAPTTALCLVMLGTALLSRGTLAPWRVRRSDLLVLACLFLAYLALIGYLYGAKQFYAWTASGRMALNTSAALLVAGLATLALDRDRGLIAVLFRRTPGGLVARTFIPIALVLLPLSGWVRLAAQRAGLFDDAFGTAFVVATWSTLFLLTTVYVAWQLDHAHVGRESAEQRAMTDELTGLPNRRYVERELARFDALNARFASSYAVLAIDADGLKRLNDTYGHGFGDLALRRFAETLVGALRSDDVAARVGGDEFLALLPGADRTTAERVADRVRESFLRTRSTEQGATLTGSVGVSAWRAGLSAHEVLAEADRALYAAKSKTGPLTRAPA